MPFVTVPEAAIRLGIAPQTVKRRLKRGKLRGRQETTPQGFVWLVDVPDIPNYHRGGITNGIPVGISDSDADIPSGINGVPVGTPDGDLGARGDILTEDSPYNEAPSILERVAILNTELEGQRVLIASLNEQVQTQKEQLSTKDRQLENKDRQIGELHVLLQQAQAALPAPRDNRPWWRKVWRRD
jgi:hypothetical protein